MVVVGSGTHFLSGISVYTVRLANALVGRHSVGMITMRRLIPTRLYPGWKRVGADLARLEHDARVSVFDGVDWYWLPSIFGASLFLMRQRPQIIIFEWWTGTVVHSYIALAVLAKLLGARVIVEFHEVIATEEVGIPLARRYVSVLAPILMRLADGFATHSRFDQQLAVETWRLDGRKRPIEILPHGPHDHYQADVAATDALREPPTGVVNLLFFGVIRPYKGLENLVAAFEAIPEPEIGGYWLTVVGETWEGWTLPTELINGSRRRDRITFVNRYVSDTELDGYMRGADAVVLPYLRSSLSGPLHVAMGYGLPILMTDVGGNAEAAAGYGGIILTPAGDQDRLIEGLRSVSRLAGTRYEHPHSWSHTAEAFERLFERLRHS